MTTDYSPLLPRYLDELTAAAGQGAILDLACGSGRNGLYLIEQGIPVVFADISATNLAQVEHSLTTEHCKDRERLATLWPADFEQSGENPFDGRMFAGVLVYRYLHRPLFESLRRAIYPGGIVIYETFTVDQPLYGRPKNPDFLLQHGELREQFSGWNVLHSFEGAVPDSCGDAYQAIAQIVAIKGGGPNDFMA